MVVLEGLEYLCAAESVVGQDETQDVAFANRQIREHTERPIHDLRNESQDVNSSDTLQENELSNFPDAVSAISHLDVSTNSEALSFSRCSSRSDDTFRRKVLTTLLLCLDGISSDASLSTFLKFSREIRFKVALITSTAHVVSYDHRLYWCLTAFSFTFGFCTNKARAL